MKVVGLTGSIGMGKTTTASMFAARGIPVHSSDDAVHALYSSRAAPLIEQAFPGTTKDGHVDRKALAAIVLDDRDMLHRLEGIIHPLVREEELAFLNKARADGAELAVLDIPLLLESGDQDRADIVVVVTADPEIQRERVLSRPGMTEEKLTAILNRQMPDADKRTRADFIVDTSDGIESAERQVADILRALGHQD